MRRLLIWLPWIAVMAASPPARAVDCSTLTNPVYFQTGDTQLNLMKRLARALRDNTGHEITLVFTTSGSCTNMGVLYNQTVVTANMQYVPSTLEDPTWTPASATLPCTPKTGGQLLDVANMIVFPSSCPNSVPPGFVRTFPGPIQGMVMAVQKNASQKAITFEEAYFVFGFGMAGMVSPWIDETQLFIRTVTKGTLLSWAAAISVPAAKWKGVRFDQSTDVVSHLIGAPDMETALGILGVEVYDANRDTLKALAWRAKDQYAAYYPDSTSDAHDKKNIRDGHYTAWSPTIWMDVVDANNVPRSTEARYVLDVITNKSPQPDPNFDIVTIESTVGLVPDCAMSVSREYDGGPLSLYRPATSCNCKFDSLVATTSCQTCTDTCATGVCRGGFCEDH
jgi:hypothetical protein